MNKDKFDESIKQIYSAVEGLREMFPIVSLKNLSELNREVKSEDKILRIK